jgi:hypothetical protein
MQIFCINANAQNEGLIENFLRKVEEIQKKESSVDKISSKKKLSDRVFKITIEMDSGRMKCVKRIRYYKGGLKKELLKYYHLPSKFMVLELVKINDKIDYAKYRESLIDQSNNIKITGIEIFIDNKYYKKTLFDNSGKIPKEENIIITGK